MPSAKKNAGFLALRFLSSCLRAWRFLRSSFFEDIPKSSIRVDGPTLEG